MAPSEYPELLTLKDIHDDFIMELGWAHNTSHLAIAMSIRGTGWLGLGMGEVGVTMSGADIIMAGIVSREVIIEDMHSTSQSQPGGDDEPYISTEHSIGLEFVEGVEIDGVSTVEYIIALSNNDSEGYDHNWKVGNTYGFFAAYQYSDDDFLRQHTSHSESLTVTLLDQSTIPPQRLNHVLEIDKSLDSIKLTSRISGVEKLSDLEVSFFRKSLYGWILLKTVRTDENGNVSIDVPIEAYGEVTYYSVITASINYSRSVASQNVFIFESDQSEDIEHGDLRDVFGNDRLIRSIVLFCVYSFIAIVFWFCLKLVYDLYRIFKLGGGEKASEEGHKK
jgi:hypothetical protein